MTLKEFLNQINADRPPVTDEFQIMVALTDPHNDRWHTYAVPISRAQWGLELNFGQLILYPELAIAAGSSQRDNPEPIIEETLYEGRRTRISRQCAMCKERVTLQMKFCPHCGQALDTYKKNLVYKGCWNNSKPKEQEENHQ